MSDSRKNKPDRAQDRKREVLARRAAIVHPGALLHEAPHAKVSRLAAQAHADRLSVESAGARALSKRLRGPNPPAGAELSQGVLEGRELGAAAIAEAEQAADAVEVERRACLEREEIVIRRLNGQQTIRLPTVKLAQDPTARRYQLAALAHAQGEAVKHFVELAVKAATLAQGDLSPADLHQVTEKATAQALLSLSTILDSYAMPDPGALSTPESA